MQFYTRPHNQRALGAAAAFPCIVLVSDNWNDFGYYTMFDAFYHPAEGQSVELGYIKIMMRGQSEGQRVELLESFPALDDRYCSLGQTMHYYRQMCRL